MRTAAVPFPATPTCRRLRHLRCPPTFRPPINRAAPRLAALEAGADADEVNVRLWQVEAGADGAKDAHGRALPHLAYRALHAVDHRLARSPLLGPPRAAQPPAWTQAPVADDDEFSRTVEDVRMGRIRLDESD